MTKVKDMEKEEVHAAVMHNGHHRSQHANPGQQLISIGKECEALLQTWQYSEGEQEKDREEIQKYAQCVKIVAEKQAMTDNVDDDNKMDHGSE